MIRPEISHQMGISFQLIVGALIRSLRFQCQGRFDVMIIIPEPVSGIGAAQKPLGRNLQIGQQVEPVAFIAIVVSQIGSEDEIVDFIPIEPPGFYQIDRDGVIGQLIKFL